MLEKVKCIFGHHVPNQNKFQNESHLVVVGLKVIQLGDSGCIHCEKEIKVIRVESLAGFSIRDVPLQLASKSQIAIVEEWEKTHKFIYDD